MAAFLSHLTSERRLSPHTVKSYGRDIAALLTNTPPLSELSEHDVRRCIALLHGRGLSGRSLARMLSAWRGFFAFLIRDHGFEKNPAMGIRPPKGGKTLPSALSPDAASQLMRMELDDPLAVRDRAIHELFYSSGLRLAELVALKPEDLSDGMVKVTGKGNKTRLVPVGSRALEALEQWLVTRARIIKPGEKALFLNSRGTRLSPRTIQARMKDWALKLGLAQNVHPHMLRHSFASHVLQSSGDLRAVQEMLGHASIASTQVYSHLDFQALAKVYDAAHPRAKKKTE
ncbi:MAG: tyrosine recombinase XerC [Burkholderiales bacterium]